jgi:hypothetical protein
VGKQMAKHDFVVKRIAKYHRDLGDDVFAQASGLTGYPRPPTYYGARGAAYIPDVYVRNKDLIYEVEPYFTLRNQISQIKAFSNARPSRLIVVLSTGTEEGVPRINKLLKNHGIECDVLNYKELRCWQ